MRTKKYNALMNANLQAFMAVALNKSVHKAAKAIYLSQAATTQRIQSLEEKLNTTLFIRTQLGMQLTTEGEKLLRYCKTVQDLSGETLSSMNDAGIDIIQRVRISGPSSLMISRIIPKCVMLMNHLPKLYLDFDINDTPQIMQSLREGLSQFAILKPEDVGSEMSTKLLAPEQYLLVASKKWHKRKLKDILTNERIIDFDETDQMTFNYLRHFNLLNNVKTDRLFVNRNESLSQMFIEGYGYGVLTKEFGAPYLKSGELIALNTGKTFDNFLSLVWYKRPDPPSYFTMLIDKIN